MSKLVEEVKENIKKRNIYQDVKITPTMAKELLELNRENRPIKQKTVAFYAEEMKQGRWLVTGDSIRFSKEGRLIDGQHRLLAIISSELPQTFNIQTGLDDEAFAAIDQGKNRSNADIVAIAGYADSTALANMVRMILTYERGHLDKGKTLDKKDRLTPQEILEWLESKASTAVLNCIASGKAFNKDFKMIQTYTYAGFLYLFSRKSMSDANEFFRLLSTGEGISKSKNSSIYILRQKLINSSGLNVTRIDMTNKYALIIKAWNFWRNQKEITRLYWSTDEEFPKIK